MPGEDGSGQERRGNCEERQGETYPGAKANRLRLAGAVIVALVGAMACAQTPDVVIRMDVNPHYRIDKDGVSNFRWYDSLGKHSTVGL